jgi:DsbC/DsbD-like thiol-disulfide interchange protein
MTVALHFRPKEGWHGYWSNPGDAGLGMRLDWRLPEGWTAGEPQYPVPTRLVLAGLMNHVFKGDYAVLVPITVPENADVATGCRSLLRRNGLPAPTRSACPKAPS